MSPAVDFISLSPFLPPFCPMSSPRRSPRLAAHLSEGMRRRIINLVEERHRSPAGVARALLVSRQTVNNTIAHFHRTGHVHDSHTGGRGIAYDDETMERLRNLILKRGRLSAKGLLREMGSSAPPISERTMQRYRRALHRSPRHGRIAARERIQHHTERAA